MLVGAGDDWDGEKKQAMGIYICRTWYTATCAHILMMFYVQIPQARWTPKQQAGGRRVNGVTIRFFKEDLLRTDHPALCLPSVDASFGVFILLPDVEKTADQDHNTYMHKGTRTGGDRSAEFACYFYARRKLWSVYVVCVYCST